MKCHDYVMTRSFILVLLMLISPVSMAGLFKQPAYLTSACFGQETYQDQQGYTYCKLPLYVLPANQKIPGLKLILTTLLVDLGPHVFYAEIKDGSGRNLQTVTHTVEAKQKDMPYVIVVQLGEMMFPQGNIFIKIFDEYDGHKTEIVTFRILTK